MKYLVSTMVREKNKKSEKLKGHESVCISVIARVSDKRHLFQSCTFFMCFAGGAGSCQQWWGVHKVSIRQESTTILRNGTQTFSKFDNVSMKLWLL